MMERRVIIGKIGAPHGVKGEASLIPLTDFPERLANLRRVYLEGGLALEIDQLKCHNRKFIVKFKQYDSRDAIEGLRNRLVEVDRSSLPNLPDGEYYKFDIIGLNVVDAKGRAIGKITEILRTGSNDVYVVSGESGETLLPALKSVVSSIDLNVGVMTVNPPETLD